ncbi:PREDICTED: TSL-kinase interacting protein 1 [Nelumbo nucifera]|uniref:TSL-kinase interacting protein 1 n=1 Tax=Nelumbo nucifera TaxID=4432 RepID=A0A1U7YVD1_NELNU|nr:PREDICTED: TSL-kinase interacting protein 1 [Nelumbo nucifera]XP_010241826.1 PREDICTED: TSL-kinase interacting protein 1 [Nelumbo nucifera]XP_010241827.1 PREDICTED: TSL-kinase interacting protein 1 [Nelumbo nucifera]
MFAFNMHTKSQVPLECAAPLSSENLLIKDGDSGVALISQSVVVPQQPVKKQTRQWAAWTRQEEESFFNALRQVGKNFEKITCRVQSKNKDQVRHYYYRLVRRMNKLLGPGISLDAKNSKDTNAAMLRWWSLLEKYSCKSSKLHLKPRRLKIFVEALEHQLLKDRKKNIRKQPSQGDNCLSTSPTTVLLHSKTPGNDTNLVKLVTVDNQSIQKVGSGKGSSLKRNVNTGINRSNNKGHSSTSKTRQRRKTGASPAAYKRWEKAAMAGVSLVADAAEHLERETANQKDSQAQRFLNESFSGPVVLSNAQTDAAPLVPTLPVLTSSAPQVIDGNAQQSLKLKLQLFPIDEVTRKALEKDEHNPYLELTLSGRKKISSVLEHLNRKWGNSSIASGDLILFPYSVQRENLVGYPRWKQDTVASAADVYAIIGSPPIFRLRYGWFSDTELDRTFQASTTSNHVREEPALSTSHLVECFKDRVTSMTAETSILPSYTDCSKGMTGNTAIDPDGNLPVSSVNSSWFRKEIGDGSTRRQWEEVDNLRMSNSTQLSAGEWADSLTNISIGDLLSEASRAADNNCTDQPILGSFQYLQQIPFSCDSFDAAIAAHIGGHKEKMGFQSTQVSHATSLWDAEETCDAFAFQKIRAFNQEVQSPSKIASLEACRQIANTSSTSFRGLTEELPEVRPKSSTCEGDPLDNCQSDVDSPDSSAKELIPENSAKDLSPKNSSDDLDELTDIYWPDSLGPLDLDIPSPKYHRQDLFIGDSTSFSGLNRLIASSLDVFQNCSFFGLDKESSSTGEARTNSSLSDYRIGGEV